jgi:2'-5' RNA ligase
MPAGKGPESQRVRSFLAVAPSAETHARLVQLKREFAATGADIRWVHDEGLHCTLKFLGAAAPDQLERLRADLAAALCDFAAFEATAADLGAFPSMNRPRVLWVAFASPQLPELAGRIEQVAAALGFARENRPFQGHITLGRVRSRARWDRVEELVKLHRGESFGTSRVDCVTLYRSDLRPDGARYTPLWTIALRATSL